MNSFQSPLSSSQENAFARPKIAFVFLLLISLIAALVFWLIYTKLLVWRGPFYSDEAVHALKALQFADDFQRGDWLGFILDSYRQVLYPPLHSWIMAAAYLVAGPSVLSAGTVGLFCFVAMAPVLFLAAYLLHEQYGVVAGVVAALLLLSSPPLIGFSAQIMLEDPGLLTICLTILIYFWLVRNRVAPQGYALLALGIVVTYFIRMPYGVLLAIIVLVAMLVEAKFTPIALWKRQMFYLCLTLLIVFVPWFAYLPKIPSTWSWLLNSPHPGGPEPYAISGWLFYPLAIFQLSASPWLTLLEVIATLFCAAYFWRDPKIRLLLILVLVQLVLAELNQNKQLRYIFPLLPAFFLMSGFTAAELWRWAWGTHWSIVRWLPALLTAALILYSGYVLFGTLQSLEGTLRSTESRTNTINTTSAAIANIVRGMGATLILGSTDIVNPTPALLDWYLISDEHLMEAPLAGSTAQIDEERKIMAIVDRLPLPAWLTNEFQQVLTRSEMPNKTRTLYIDIPSRATYSQSQKGFGDFIHELMLASKYDGIVVITLNKKSAKYPFSYFAGTLEAAGLRHATDRTLHIGQYQIDVFR